MAVIKRQPLPSDGDVLIENPEYKSIHEIYVQAEKWGVRTSPLDIEALIKKHGIRVLREEMSDDMSGYLEQRHTSWIIGINKYQNPRRQRFTLAHEFAHFLYDQEEIKKARHEDRILLRSEESNPTERRAHDFAASLLMPKEEFSKIVNGGVRDISQLADMFDVSMAAIRYRAFRLGFIREY